MIQFIFEKNGLLDLQKVVMIYRINRLTYNIVNEFMKIELSGKNVEKYVSKYYLRHKGLKKFTNRLLDKKLAKFLVDNKFSIVETMQGLVCHGTLAQTYQNDYFRLEFGKIISHTKFNTDTNHYRQKPWIIKKTIFYPVFRIERYSNDSRVELIITKSYVEVWSETNRKKYLIREHEDIYYEYFDREFYEYQKYQSWIKDWSGSN